MSFVDKIRMANIYPGGNSLPVGMPDMSGPNLDLMAMMSSMGYDLDENAKKADQRRKIEMMEAQARISGQSRVAQIGQAAAQAPGMQKPMNVVYNPNNAGTVSPFQREQLSIERAKLGQARELAMMKGQDTDENRAIAKQRADTYSMMHDMSDSQKQVAAAQKTMQEIIARGGIQEGLLNTRGNQQINLQDMRGDQQTARDTAQHGNRLNEIGARGNETRLTANSKPISPEKPAEQKVREFINARQLMTTHPELAKFVDVKDNGAFSIAQREEPGAIGQFFGKQGTGPTPEQLDQINELIYGIRRPAIVKDGRSILFDEYNKNPEYQTDSSKSKTKKPGQKTTTSKYQVSVN